MNKITTFIILLLLSAFCTQTWGRYNTSTTCNFSVSISKTDVDCYGNATGSATANITGPAGTYTYQWSNDKTGNEITDLTASTYFVKVNDENGCEIIDFIQITQPDKIEINNTVTNINCYGENTGEIHLSTSGGIPGYTYRWSNGSENASALNLYAGAYMVTVNDENFCTNTDTFNITQPAEISETHIIKNVTGYGLANGTINMNISGGIKPYSYNWYKGGYLHDTVEDLNDLTAGNYDLILTDVYNCQFSRTFNISQPDLLTAGFVVQNVDCSKGESGSIGTTISGGVQPYNAVWANSEIVLESGDKDINDLEKGTYYITVTDANENIFEDSVVVQEPSPILVNFEVSDVTCHGGSDGNVLLSVSGGVSPYSFQWSNGTTDKNLTNVTKGNYQVDIVDLNGCVFSGKIDIDQPKPFVLDVEQSQITCKDASDGILSISVSGNTAPYSVTWNTGQTGFYADELAQGRYELYITDINQCDTSYVTNMVNPPNGCIYIPNAFTPNNDGYNDTWVIENTYLYPEMELNVYNKSGALVHKGNIDSAPWDGKYKNEDMASGTYYYTLNLNNGDLPFKGTVTIVR